MRHQRSMYIPHDRVQEDGSIVNPHTGEVSYPPSMTKQEFTAECDINNIIKAFTLTGQVSHMSAKAAEGAFMDLPDDLDLQQAIQIVDQAEAAFMALPAKVRDRFHNQPGEFLAFMSNPENQKEAQEMGLLNVAPTPVPPAPPPTPADPAEAS